MSLIKLSDRSWLTPKGIIDFDAKPELTHAQETHNRLVDFEIAERDRKWDYDCAKHEFNRAYEIWMMQSVQDDIKAMSTDEKFEYLRKYVDYRIKYESANKYVKQFGVLPFEVFIASILDKWITYRLNIVGKPRMIRMIYSV